MFDQNIIPGCYYRLGDNIVKAYITGKNEIRFDNFMRADGDFLVDSFYSLTPQGDKILFPADNTPIRVESIPLCTEFFEEQIFFNDVENRAIEEYALLLELYCKNIKFTMTYWFVDGDENILMMNTALWIVEYKIVLSPKDDGRKIYIPVFRMDRDVACLHPVSSVDQLQMLLNNFYVNRNKDDDTNLYNHAAMFPQEQCDFKFTFNYLNK